MTNDIQHIASPSRVRRFFRFVSFRIFPALLIIAIVWSSFRVIDVFLQRYGESTQIDARHDAYSQTATAIVPSGQDELSAEQSMSDDIVLVQVFATNTPQPDDTSGENQPIATNTPPPDVAVTPVPEATKINLLAERTPINLPPLLQPPLPEEGLLLSGTAVPTKVPVISREYDLVNILLLGGDDELTSDNFLRTDTMLIVSINLNTGTVAMLSLPRDLFVYIPSGTMQRLNVAYAIGENIGWQPDGGFGLLRQTIFYNMGINVHYFARVNFTGFEEIIDTLGGIDVAVDCAYQDYYPVEDFDLSRSIEENYELRTLPIGYYHMNGFDALWYARTRKVSDDFDRGRRQQQILRSIWRAARSGGELANLPTLWGQVTDIVDTNIGFDEMLGLLPFALNLETGQIENFTMIRTYHTQPWQPPSGDFVQLPVYEPIQQLLLDFYQPPSSSQLALAGPSIAVYNGTENESWDLVASERLVWEGFTAVAAGNADSRDYAETILIDHVGEDKGSVVGQVAQVLNIHPDQIILEPDPNRSSDYEIILGSNYNSCTFAVLPITG